MTENVIEFIKGEETATVTFSQGRYIGRIRKLAAAKPDECKIIVENPDGSIMAHVPVSWVRVSPPAQKTEKQREAARRTMLKMRQTDRI